MSIGIEFEDEVKNMSLFEKQKMIKEFNEKIIYLQSRLDDLPLLKRGSIEENARDVVNYMISKYNSSKSSVTANIICSALQFDDHVLAGVIKWLEEQGIIISFKQGSATCYVISAAKIKVLGGGK